MNGHFEAPVKVKVQHSPSYIGKERVMKLAALGWNEDWRQKFAALASERMVPARVVGEHEPIFELRQKPAS